MVKETFVSFFGNLKERTSNPFLGTFTAIYIVMNWKIFYAVFNFQETVPVKDRIAYLIELLKDVAIWWPIFFTFIGVLVLYLTKIAARYSGDFLKYKIYPKVDKLIGDKTIYTKDEYEKLQKEHDRKQYMLAELRQENEENERVWNSKNKSLLDELRSTKDENLELKKSNQNLNTELKSLWNENKNFRDDNKSLKNENELLQQSNRELINKSQIQFQKLNSIDLTRKTKPSLFSISEIKTALRRIKSNPDVVSDFIKIYPSIRANQPISKAYFETIDYLYRNKLILKLNEVEGEFYNLTLSNLGQRVYEHLSTKKTKLYETS